MAFLFDTKYIAYISVSKPTPWAVARPHGQLASTQFFLEMHIILKFGILFVFIYIMNCPQQTACLAKGYTNNQ